MPIITFDPNGGSGGTTRNVSYGQPIGTLPTPHPPTHPRYGNYQFLGWFTKPAGGGAVSSGTICTGDATYYAQYSRLPLLRWPDGSVINHVWAVENGLPRRVYGVYSVENGARRPGT